MLVGCNNMALVIKKFVTGMHYVALPETVTLPFEAKGQRRVKATVQGSVTFHAAILPHKQIGNFIFISNKILNRWDW